MGAAKPIQGPIGNSARPIFVNSAGELTEISGTYGGGVALDPSNAKVEVFEVPLLKCSSALTGEICKVISCNDFNFKFAITGISVSNLLQNRADMITVDLLTPGITGDSPVHVTTYDTTYQENKQYWKRKTTGFTEITDFEPGTEIGNFDLDSSGRCNPLVYEQELFGFEILRYTIGTLTEGETTYLVWSERGIASNDNMRQINIPHSPYFDSIGNSNYFNELNVGIYTANTIYTPGTKFRIRYRRGNPSNDGQCGNMTVRYAFIPAI